MTRQLHSFPTPELSRPVELLVLGEGPAPLLCFPTSLASFSEIEEQCLIPAGQTYTLYCASSADAETLLDCTASPRQRIERHSAYERAIVHQIAPLIQRTSGRPTFGVCGVGLGGYQAFNFAMRHPDLVHACVTFGAPFDLRGFFRGYFDEDVYYHNPVEYLPNLADPWFINRYREMRIVLTAGEQDLYVGENHRMSGILHGKSISHWLDVWGQGAGHDWVWWRQMAQKHFT